jgi:hypothetical protein
MSLGVMIKIGVVMAPDEPIYKAVMIEPEGGPRILEVHKMEEQSQRPPPHSTFQLIGQTTQDVVGGVTKTPLMLGVILLNVAGIAAAVYFLNILISGQQTHLGNLLTLQTNNLNTVIETHNREFDALMLMNAKITEALKEIAVAPPPLPPPTQPQPPAPSTRGRP